MYCITQYNQYNRAGSPALDSFETCRADEKLWNKIDYKNCASRWLLTHYVLYFYDPFSLILSSITRSTNPCCRFSKNKNCMTFLSSIFALHVAVTPFFI